MAATDLLMEVGDPGTATSLSAPGYTAGGTSVTVGSTTGWPTATGVIFAIDEAEVVNGEEVQVAGTYNEYAGNVASGTSVTTVSWQRGVGDRNYAAGALTRVYIPVSAERENRIVEWGVNEHNQDGTHDEKIITSRSTKATPTTSDVVMISDAAASNVLKKATVGTLVPPTSVGADKLNLDTGTATVATSQSTASASFTDLTTPGPAVTVTIGANGKAWVTFGARAHNDTVNGAAVAGVDISGANTIAAADAVYVTSSTASAATHSTYSKILTGLTPGSTTFTLKYKRSGGANAAFAERVLSVIPL
jgi:hypothetical protein